MSKSGAEPALTISGRASQRSPLAQAAEAASVTAAGGLLLLALSLPAFSAFFLGEDFIYLGQLSAHGGDYWRAVLAPTDGIFFRPVFAAANLLWQFVLPLDPVLHHVRNYGFSVLNVLLLYLVMVELGIPVISRIIGVFVFAISKVHMTAIGYINTYDSVVSLMLLLLAIWLWLKYCATRRPIYLAFALITTFLSVFTKDYGLVSVAVIITVIILRPGKDFSWRRDWRFWAPRLAVLPMIVAVYGIARYNIVGPLPATNEVYAPRFSPEIAVHKLVLFTSTIGNLAFVSPETIGPPGLGSWLASFPLVAGRIPRTYAEMLLYCGLVSLLAISLWYGRLGGRMLFLPIVWIGVYLGPTLLTRNEQIYYQYEPLAGSAVLIALCLRRAPFRLVCAWAVSLPLIAASGAISNFNATYTWQFTTNKTAQIQTPILAAYRNRPPLSLTFVTRSYPFWSWALTADGQAPMLPQLLQQPLLKVGFIDYRDVPAAVQTIDDEHVVFDIDNGFVPLTATSAAARLRLVSVSPARAIEGSPFNVQPDGASALGISAEGATPATSLVVDGEQAQTMYVDARYLTALLPSRMLVSQGEHQLFLTNGITESNRILFVVDSASDAANEAVGSRANVPTDTLVPLALDSISPNHTRAGQPFSEQPDGQSALSVSAENAEPGTVIVFDEDPLSTAFGNSGWLTALVPSELYGSAGRHMVHLRDGERESNRLEFVVE